MISGAIIVKDPITASLFPRAPSMTNWSEFPMALEW